MLIMPSDRKNYHLIIPASKYQKAKLLLVKSLPLSRDFYKQKLESITTERRAGMSFRE